jgi:tetratricopeptide (TPR) repeat protein
MALTRSNTDRPMRETMRSAGFARLLLAGLLCGTVTGSLYAADPRASETMASQRTDAERSLMQGRIDEAIAMAQRITAANPEDGETYIVLCRSYYAEEHLDEAVNACEKAVQLLPRSSVAQDWMGRACGRQAEHAGPISGLTLALKVKTAFEAAVAIDPENGNAVDDLSEFYVGAPFVIGGGLDKATALADRVVAQLPQPAARIRALVAQKRKDYGTAEQSFRAATEVANKPDAWTDLAMFYRQRGQYDKAVDALKRCIEVDHAKDASLVDAASLLIEMHREPGLAEQALREYQQSDAKSDDAPLIKADVMLGKLLASSGDKAGAKIEFDQALTMAPAYAAAREAQRKL